MFQSVIVWNGLMTINFIESDDDKIKSFFGELSLG